MSPFSLRSLLLAAVILSNCITWTASRHHYTHNVSGHRSRHRRQGAGLFLSASHVLPGGEGTGWGEWGEVSPCSRTCGGGVASQKRICLEIGPDGQPQCSGGDTKYFSCQTQDCPAGSKDFRAQQCSEFDDLAFRDIKYKWVPYTQAPNPCELNCMPHGERFYYRHKRKVVDGTRCNDESFDVCVNGTCQPVGCDMMLGSSAREDKCRECRGNGANCETNAGVLDTKDLRKGYNDILLIPEGATTIVIAERAPSNNYLALRAKNGTYYLNGEYHIDFPRSLIIAGALWYYERSQQGFAAPDKLRCLGPINEPLYLALLLQDENVGIDYEYSVPSEKAPPRNKQYNWVHEEFTPCSEACGGGFQTRNVTCRSREELELVDEGLCDREIKPPTNQTCNTEPCNPEWTLGPWGNCSKRCGEGGTRSREVQCTQIITNGYPSIVAEKKCFELHGPKPELFEKCNENATCPVWFTGNWKPCDKLCDEGKQTRKVVCYQKNDGRIEVLSDEECEDEKPAEEQTCLLQLCDGVDWVLSKWTGCDSCLSTVRTRFAVCTTKAGAMVNESFCAYHEKPETQQPCDKTLLPACEVQWYATQWSNCSVECGKGTQTRKVFCGLFDGTSVMKVPDERCAGTPKYNDTKECEIPKEKCPSQWFAGPWSACTKKCGGGDKYRRVMCMRGGEPATDCDKDMILDDTQSCNTGPCKADGLLTVDGEPAAEDDLEFCVDEEETYPEVGVDAEILDKESTPISIDHLMLSDTTLEGSGMWTFTTAEHESEFETDSSLSSEELIEATSHHASNDTDFDESEEYSTAPTDIDFAGTNMTESESPVSPGSMKNITETDEAITGTATTVSGSFETDNSTETILPDSTYTTETIESANSTTTPDSTEKTESSNSTATTPSGSTETTENGTETLVSGSTNTTEIIEIDNSTSTTVFDNSTSITVPGSTDATEATEDTNSTATTVLGSTNATETTETANSTETTVSESTNATDATENANSTATTESGNAETSNSTETTVFESTNANDTTVTSDNTAITVSGITETAEFDNNTATSSVLGSTYTTEMTETDNTTATTTSGSINTTEITETDNSTITTVSGSTENTENSTATTISESTNTTETMETVNSTDATVSEIPTNATDTLENANSTATTVSGSTETDNTTETAVSENTNVTDTTETDNSTATSVSVSTFTTEMTETDNSTATTVSGSTNATEISETDNSTATTVSGITETSNSADTIVYESSNATDTTESANSTATPISGSTETTDISNVTATTVSGSTETTENSTEISVTGSANTTEMTETDNSTATTVSGRTETTENSTEISVTSSGNTTEITETDNSTATTVSRSTETTENSTEISATSSANTTEITGTHNSTATTVSGSTETTENSTEISATSSANTTEITETDNSTATTVSGSTETTENSTEISVTSSGNTTEMTETDNSTLTTATGSTEYPENSTATSISQSTNTTETTETANRTETTAAESTNTTDTTENANSTATTVPGSTNTTDSTEPTNITTTEKTETDSTETTNVTATTESGSTGDMNATDTIITDISNATETTEIGNYTETIETTTETMSNGSATATESTLEFTTETLSENTTRWDLSSTVEYYTTKKMQVCRLRKCGSAFGCCPDKKTPALGPFEEGCPKPVTCREALYGCCPDGLSPAQGPNNEGCPTEPCEETLFGCCQSDNKTAAEGNDQEGCPPPPPACNSSKYGCCKDGETEATGPEKEGCPETSTTVSYNETTFVTDTEETETSTISSSTGTISECAAAEFGCCFDNETAATGPEMQGCPCNTTEFGCCPDGIAPAQGPDFEGCVKSCNTSAYGCCPDGKTPAHGPDSEGCCLLSSFGCCPDNHKPADGPHLEGCGCQHSRFGCCPDNKTVASGPENKGCGCQYTQHGCCPDRHSEASGPDFEGCKCHTYQFGCCPDGVTISVGPNGQGCYCQQSTYGCCGDEQTHAKGPNKEGCDCATSKYGCCLDGTTEASGPKFEGCPDKPENKQAACSLKFERGPCRNYSVNWFYDTDYGGCSRFWYGGCEGNGNRFGSKEECEDTCVSPPPKDACKLPQIQGACGGYNVRWYYDSKRESCTNFVYGGCLGNNNNFETRELCQAQCEPERALDQCSLEIERGSCAGNYPRWGFNKQNRRCEEFIWGGCEGNSNRFSTEAACLLRCNPPGEPQPECSEPQEVGNCSDTEALWSFRQSENRCVPFYYTGCGGNGNKFSTQEDCQLSCPSPFVPELCTLPASTGDCADYREKWYYDTKDQRCRQFYYGGCGGNGNKFNTEQECERRCAVPTATTVTPSAATAAARPQPDPDRSDFCFMEIDAGPCNQWESKWAYDYTKGKCVAFQYGGCGGNQNNFPTEEHCTYYCKPKQDICQLPMLTGPCDGSVMNWFYDATSDSCSQFTYGGCEGNDNRFASREDCEIRCKTGPAPSTVSPLTTTTVKVVDGGNVNLPSECIISPALEQCSRSAFGEVWYYNNDLHKCESHQNLETGANCRTTGVFYSQEACERSCGAFRNIDVCKYPMQPGPCRAYLPKYHYNATSRRCEEFVYGGCLGGPNQFSTAQECQQICMATLDPCTLPVEPGNCIDRIEMWYYDQSRDQCYMFAYGGCGGNDNKFESRELCESRCRGRPVIEVTTSPVPLQATTQEPLEECRTPVSLAPCGTNITAYYYDEGSSKCKVADIGACSYSNRYRSEEECERRCGSFKGLEVCRAPLDPGPCRASIPKFYFDTASGSCMPYAYGGCNGGPNRFSTSEECEEICAGAGPDETESKVCDQYAEECINLELSCEHDLKKVIAPEGCERCVCQAPVSCESEQRACDVLNCQYGIQRIKTENGCERCECLEDPCSRSNCASNERCVASAYRDPVTQGVMFSAHCVPEHETNEVVPTCDAYMEECERLSCPVGSALRRVTEGACVRCTCEPQDCSQELARCTSLDCPYGISRSLHDGCDRCECLSDPCIGHECSAGERCVSQPFRDAITQEIQYAPDCRSVNKPGSCPWSEETKGASGPCRTECSDDADCRGVLKCCSVACSQTCVAPATLDSTTHRTDIPRAPQASAETVPQVAASEGGKAMLHCIFHGNPPPRITWRFGEITIDGDVDRYRILSDGALEIISLFRNDSGVYICVAENELGSAQQEITLNVNDPVRAAAEIAGAADATVTGELDQPVVVVCRAFGYPPPSIFWYRGDGGAMVPYSSAQYEARGQELKIRRLTVDTLGEYECQAYNGEGRPAIWRVAVLAYQPRGAYIPGNRYLVPRPDRQLAVTPRTPTVATPPPDLQVPSYAVPVHTELLPSSTSVSVGAQLSLPCEVDGYPEPEVHWTKDNVLIAPSERIWITGSRLTIPAVELNDSGVYSCHAANAYSSHSSTVRITVQEVYVPAKCVDNPTFANCALIVQSKFCRHKYYSRFCCKSCVEAGQLDPRDVEMQADEAFRKK